MNDLLFGAIGMGSLIVALFFFRYWRSTRDTFFLYFSLSFLIESANRLALGLLVASELEPVFYMVRIVAYGLIVVAILQKNRKRS